MNPNRLNRTKTIGIKVSHECFDELRAFAASRRKPLAEWCRDTVLKAIHFERATPTEYALMAELTATQSIVIDLLCALGHDGKLTQQKAQAVVDAAHSAKYKEAAELLKYASTEFQSGRLETASDQGTADKR